MNDEEKALLRREWIGVVMINEMTDDKKTIDGANIVADWWIENIEKVFNERKRGSIVASDPVITCNSADCGKCNK